MRKSPEKPRSNGTAPWWWTAALFSLSAILVAGAGVMLARQTDRISVKPPGNQADDSFRQIARRVDEMERLWQTALENEASRLLAAGSAEMEIEVSGVAQYSGAGPSSGGWSCGSGETRAGKIRPEGTG